MRNTGKTQVNSALLSIQFALKCKTLQVKNPLKCAPDRVIVVQQLNILLCIMCIFCLRGRCNLRHVMFQHFIYFNTLNVV